MANINNAATDEFLALEFLTLRLENFRRLEMKVKKLILSIEQYYLGTFYPFDSEASTICLDIERAKKNTDIHFMDKCHQAFLEFLPIKLRSNIQGKNLFRQPSQEDLVLTRSYVNNLEVIERSNQEMFTPSEESGLSQLERAELAAYLVEKEIQDLKEYENDQPHI